MLGIHQRLALTISSALLCGAVVGADIVQTAAAQSTSADQRLIEQARYWQDRGRYDLARESWLKLLKTEENQVTALANLGELEASAGRPAAAQQYLDQLKEVAPNSPRVRELQAAITQSTINEDALDRARALAQEGSYDEAVVAYRDIFGGTEPEGRLALEYYQTLAGAENGWDDARRGLESLTEDYPDTPIYQLALAQHLTYRENTRRKGISQLAELSGNPVVGQQAKDGWRQALLWLNASGDDAKFFRAYVERVGDDAEVAARLKTLRQVRGRSSVAGTGPTRNPIDDLVAAAYGDLNEGDLDLATTQFEEVLRLDPDNADGLGGIGIILLRQERFSDAVGFLQQAQAADPSRARRWQEALDSAQFWSLARRGEAARAQGDAAQAIALFEEALRSRPDEFSVRNTLGDVYAEQGDLQRAEAQFRASYAANPQDVDAIRGLVGVLTRNGMSREALSLAQSLPQSMQNQIGDLSSLKAQFLRDKGSAELEAGNDQAAEATLREALILDPDSAWVRLDLAKIYRRAGRIRDANTLIDGLLASNPRMPDALFVKATLLADGQKWYDALRVLERIPLASRQRYMNDLQRRVWVRYQTERASVFARYGRPQQAATIIRQVEPLVGSQPELLGAIASALAEIGEEGEALRYMRQALSRQSTPDAGLRVQYASLLFKLRQDAEFKAQIDDLNNQPGLTAQQRQNLARLQVAYRLRQADLIREDGNYALAYEQLEPMLRLNPNDPRLLMGLARLYNDAGEFERTLTLYDRVLAVDPENLDAYKGGIAANVELRRGRAAEQLLSDALEIYPNNPRLYALGGRIARLRGNDGQALEFYRQALALDARREQSDLASGVPEASNWRNAPTLHLVDPASVSQRGQQLGALTPTAADLEADIEALLALAEPTQSMAVPQDTVVEVLPLMRGGVAVRTSGNEQTVYPPYQATQESSQAPPVPPGYRASPAVPASQRPLVAPQGGAVGYGGGSGGARSDGTAIEYNSYRTQSTQSGVVQVQQAAPQTYRQSAPVRAAYPGYPGDQGYQGQRTAPQPAQAPQSGAYQQTAPIYRSSSAPVVRARQIQSAPGVYGSGYSVPFPRSDRPTWLETTLTLPQSDTAQPSPTILGPTSYPVAQPQPVAQSQPVYQSAVPIYTVPAQPLQMAPVISQGPVAAPAPRQPSFVAQRPQVAEPRPPARRRAPTRDPRDDLLREIREIETRRSGFGGIGISLRNRDGQEGLGQLFDLEIPAEVSTTATGAGRLRLRAIPVILDAGTVQGPELAQFGTLPLVTGVATNDRPDLAFDQSDAGVSFGLVYEVGQLRADIGTTPVGFEEEDLQGGLRFQPRSQNLVWNIDLSRRSVEDSLLSYAGTFDPGLGVAWGGVMKTGGRVDLAYDAGGYGAYVNGSLHTLDGNNVEDNSVIEAGTGFYVRGIEAPSYSVTWGVNVTTFFYEENLRRFTFGHGGYFSPQFYMSVGLPVELLGGFGRFSYRANGSVGIQAFREDSAPIFPTSAALQLQLEQLAADNPNDGIQTQYPSQSSTGLGLNFLGEAEYLLAPNISIGGRLGFDNARDFNQYSTLGFIRYSFRPQTRVSRPPSILQPDWVGDPTRP